MKFKKILTIFLTLSLFLGFGVKSAKAEGYIASTDFQALPTENPVASGFLNYLSTSFRLSIELTDDYSADKFGLYLDSCSDPVDERIFDGGLTYTFSSNEDTSAELRTLLASCGRTANGVHELAVLGSVGEATQTLWRGSLTADFILPSGTFEATATSGKLVLGAGDQVRIDYNTSDTDTAQITGSISAQQLLWEQNMGKFSALYTIQEGDLVGEGLLTIDELTVIDEALNKKIISDPIPIDFSVDATPPSLSIISPLEMPYSEKNLRLEYAAAGFDELEIYLDGNLIHSDLLENLADGNHLIRLVARDSAGNETDALRRFSVDTTAPSGGLLDPPTEIPESAGLELSGRTEPFVQVKLEIADRTYEKLSTESGDFSFLIGTLPPGSYDLFLTLKDSLGNAARFIAATIKVKPAPSLVTITDQNSVRQSEPSRPREVKVASVQSKPIAYKAQYNETKEIALNPVELPGKIASGENTSRITPWYLSWWLLFFVIIIATFLVVLSYNYYSQLAAIRITDTDVEEVKREFLSVESFNEAAQSMSSVSDEPKEVELERNNDSSEENTLRW